VANNQRYMVYMLMLSLLAAVPAQAASRLNIAAVVNDDVITTSDLSERRDLVMVTSDVPMTVENQQRFTPRVLQQMIDEALQMQEAKRLSLTVTDEELEKAVSAVSLKGDMNPSGDIRKFLTDNALSVRSLEDQVRAQLLWQKVVQRKLRRNVSIAQDEVTRAQQAQAADPGKPEVRIAAVSLPTTDEAHATKLAEEITSQLKTNPDLASLAGKYRAGQDVTFSPPIWIVEESLRPTLQQALRDLTPGSVTPPLRSSDAIQFVQLIDRQIVKPQSDNTEIAIKQIAIDVPAKRDKAAVAKLREVGEFIRKNPGDCSSEQLPPTGLPASASFARTKLGKLSAQQRSVVSHLNVGQVSDPIPGRDAVHIVMLCEKIEPATGNLPDAEAVRQRLFSEKIELEAQKHLRNLRRDAFIDIKNGASADDGRGGK